MKLKEVPYPKFYNTLQNCMRVVGICSVGIKTALEIGIFSTALGLIKQLEYTEALNLFVLQERGQREENF